MPWVQACGVSADTLGNVYITGYTNGVLDKTNYGSLDAFVSKYDAQGKLLWTRQLGTTEEDQSSGVSADGLGNVYITGFTAGSLAEPNAGGYDAFVSKYDAQGNLLWTRQLGTPEDDKSYGVSADGLGNVYISGITSGSLGRSRAGHDYDAFVSKYDSQGNLLWTRQLGTSAWDQSNAVSADRLGNVFIAGFTEDSFTRTPKGGEIVHDAFVSKYDDRGNLLWIKQMSTARVTDAMSVAADGLGNVYLSGKIEGPFDGSNSGSFVSKYDAVGNLLWSQQIGTTDMYVSQGVSTDRRGNVYLAETSLFCAVEKPGELPKRMLSSSPRPGDRRFGY